MSDFKPEDLKLNIIAFVPFLNSNVLRDGKLISKVALNRSQKDETDF